jgi:hypothetical protein
MTADNQQERPNYRLHYFTSMGDLGRVSTRCDFYASDDKDALKKAQAYMEIKDKEDKTLQNELVGLERLTFVMKEVEETTPVSLLV